MRAVAITEFGGPEKLKLVQLPVPQPAEGEVLIRIVASGVNPVDWKIREGRLKAVFPYHFPLILGWELSGVIESLGSGARRFKRGDCVWAYARKPVIQGGTYAEYIVLPEATVALMPPSLFFFEAAAVPLAGLTAYQCLEKAALKKGQTVLIHAAAGGVGHFAVQLAKARGATVYGTCSAANLEFVRSFGADAAIDYKKDFRKAIKKLSPDGVDAVLDPIGGETQGKSLDVLKPGGHLVSIVAEPNAVELKRRKVQGSFVFVMPDAAELDTLGKLADEGRLKVHLSHLFSLYDAAEAQILSQKGHMRGKMVLVL